MKTEWLLQVERYTRTWRLRRAARLERNHPDSLWHKSRATAHRERFARITACGLDDIERHCQGCGEVAPTLIRLHCDHWRLCKVCRSRRSKRHRARFELGRNAALARNKHRMHRATRGGRWAESFYTLSIPHDRIEPDADEIRAAWPRFRRALQHYLKARGCDWRKVPFFRAVELTSSTGGHWHIHVWSLLPYVPQWMLAHLWGASLSPSYRARLPMRDVRELGELHGRDAQAIAWLGVAELYAPVVDIRRADEAAQELIKYLVKDIELGVAVDPKWYARAYAALEGLRGVESSRKWLVLPKTMQGWSQLLAPRAHEAWCNCGGCLPSSRRIRNAHLDTLSPVT